MALFTLLFYICKALEPVFPSPIFFRVLNFLRTTSTNRETYIESFFLFLCWATSVPFLLLFRASEKLRGSQRMRQPTNDEGFFRYLERVILSRLNAKPRYVAYVKIYAPLSLPLVLEDNDVTENVFLLHVRKGDFIPFLSKKKSVFHKLKES